MAGAARSMILSSINVEHFWSTNVISTSWPALAVIIYIVALSFAVVAARGNDVEYFSNVDGSWDDAHATFYGDIHGNETMKGACGYGDLFKQGYGLETTALSAALFNDGAMCGACFELMCAGHSPWCLPGRPVIRVTATNFCPANYTHPVDGWCNPPRKHFDLSMPMFLKLAQYKAGIVPVVYRRVRCVKQGGIKFELKGNPNWLLVLVYNVAGDGQVVDVKIKGSNSTSTTTSTIGSNMNWIQMSRNWGQNWQTGTVLVGQGLSFQVSTSDGKVARSENVVPSNWKFGQTFEGKNVH